MFRKRIAGAGAALCLLVAGCSAPGTASVNTSIGGKSLSGIQLPAFIPGPLNGLSTPRKRALRRPLAVILENYAPDSRPQSGLSMASTVIETLAEGGVTRFMAVYLENDASKVGPVRSTRVYFDRWASAFHAILAHVGGNDDAQALLWKMPKVFNIDENRWEKSLYDTGTPLFWRSQDRSAPHNMYVNTIKLRAYAAARHQNWAYAGASLPHKSPAPLAKRGHRTTIDISFANPLGGSPNPDYAVHYAYNRSSNTYARWMGGARHVDQLNGRQIQPANVVVMQTGAATSDPFAGPTPESILIPTLRTGKAILFEDGKIIYGHWKQRDAGAPLQFFTARWRSAAFNPGQTWIEVVPQGSPISWSAR